MIAYCPQCGHHKISHDGCFIALCPRCLEYLVVDTSGAPLESIIKQRNTSQEMLDRWCDAFDHDEYPGTHSARHQEIAGLDVRINRIQKCIEALYVGKKYRFVSPEVMVVGFLVSIESYIAYVKHDQGPPCAINLKTSFVYEVDLKEPSCIELAASFAEVKSNAKKMRDVL